VRMFPKVVSSGRSGRYGFSMVH